MDVNYYSLGLADINRDWKFVGVQNQTLIRVET